VVITGGNWRLKWQVAELGHELAVGTDAVASILVYTRKEWEGLGRLRAPLWQAIQRDARRLE